MISSQTIISLDTNVLIFGLKATVPAAVRVLQRLDQFDVKIAPEVISEVRRNVSVDEMRRFYGYVRALPSFEVRYEIPPLSHMAKYRQLGLKKGDIRIAAFCDWQRVALLISENRHFLQETPDLPFEVLPAAEFCRRAGF